MTAPEVPSPAAAAEQNVPSRGPRPRAQAAPGRTLLVALAAGAAVGLIAFLLFPLLPHRSASGAEFEGDAPLVDDVSAALDPELVQGLAVARFPNEDPDGIEWVTAGTADGTEPIGQDTLFETASVFKAFTAMTLADMVENGETSLDRTLADIFPELDFSDPEIADANLEELATHHAGFVTEAETGLRGPVATLVSGDMYRTATPPLEHATATMSLNRGSYQYSNAGYAVLGEALAAESGTDYPDLVRERILDPLGMDDTYVVDDGVPEGGAGPHAEPGARVQEWRNTDYAAAGITTWSTTEDLVRFMTAVADGSAPGLGSMDPVHDPFDAAIPGQMFDGTGIGLGWHLLYVSDVGQVTWHSGGTLGSRSMVATDGEHSVVVMSNSFSTDSVNLAFDLLGDDPEPLAPTFAPWLFLSLTLAMVLLPSLLLFALVLRRRTLIAQRPLDRLRIVSLTLGSVAWLLAALRVGGWVDTPPFVWALGVALVAAALTVAVWHWSRVPVEAARWRWLRITLFVPSVLFSLALGSLALWGTLTAWS
ncbi:serine hydrolase domain-containing protein [Nocardiopsis oceani]